MLFDAQAFALGMVALLNPCGFALLPAYLGYFLGLDDPEVQTGSPLVALNRAQVVGLAMSGGFLFVFGLLGVFLAGFFNALQSSGWLSWFTVIIGAALGLLGVAMLFGYQPLLSVPKLNKGGKSRSVGSMFVFGVSYAVASLSCTMPLFFLAIGNSVSGASFLQRLGSFISYAIGMGLLATIVTLAVGFGKKGLVSRFRQFMPKINSLSGILLIAVGFYLVLYGIWSRQLLSLGPENVTPWIASIVTTVEGWQTSLSNWINSDINPLGLFDEPVARTSLFGWTFLAVNIAVAAAGLIARRRTAPTADAKPEIHHEPV